VSIVLNYEEGGESCVLHGDAHSESVLTDIGALRYPTREISMSNRISSMAAVSASWSHANSAATPARCDHLRRRHGARGNPAAVAEIVASGFEVACHGQRWIDYQSVAVEVERADMLRNIEVISRLIGRRPLGWYTGRPGPHTRRLVVQTGGFLYDSDAYNDDLPTGPASTGAPHLIVPTPSTPMTADCSAAAISPRAMISSPIAATHSTGYIGWETRAGRE